MKLSGLALSRAGALALAAGIFAQPASAASYCLDGNGGGLSLGDMTLNGASATDCYGVVAGNDKPSGIDSLVWGKGWTLLGKDESADPATFMGIAFDLDATGGQQGGWTLTAHDLDAAALSLPVELDVVAVLKAGNRYAAYFFDDAVFDGSDGGTWSIAFANHGGQVPALSHLSFYARIDEDGGVPTAAIPEAHTYALMLAGLGLVGFMAWRRTASGR